MIRSGYVLYNAKDETYASSISLLEKIEFTTEVNDAVIFESIDIVVKSLREYGVELDDEFKILKAKVDIFPDHGKDYAYDIPIAKEPPTPPEGVDILSRVAGVVPKSKKKKKKRKPVMMKIYDRTKTPSNDPSDRSFI